MARRTCSCTQRITHVLPVIYAVNQRGRNGSFTGPLGQPGQLTFPDPRRRALPGGAIAASLEVAAVASPPGSKSFAPLDAIVSSHSSPRGQARSGQDGKGAGNIGRWRGTSTMVRAERALTWTAVLGRSPADRLVRSSRGLCHGHWPAWGAFPVDGVRGTGPAGALAELHPEVQTAPFRSHWHDEVATIGLPADE